MFHGQQAQQDALGTLRVPRLFGGYWSSAKHNRHRLPKVVYSKMVLNCIHIGPVDSPSVKDKTPGRNLIRM